MSTPVEIQITVGRFVLRLGSSHGTSVSPAGKADRDQAQALADAVAAMPPVERRSATDFVNDAVGRAAEVTAGIERANDLITALAKGLTLDPRVLEKEANALLDLLDRADREGRWEDERRLARALVALLALIPRWVALIEVLRRTASAAAATGDRATQAWAHHETGSFALAADNVGIAREHLTQALEIRNSLADGGGVDLTLHNMRMLTLTQPVNPRQLRRLPQTIARHPLVAGLTALALLAAGVAATGAWSRGEAGTPKERITDLTETVANKSGPATTEEGDTTTEGGDTTTGESGTTTGETDTVAPVARLNAPGRFVSNVITLSAFARDAGGSGLDALVFEVAELGTDSWRRLGSDFEQPYSLSWETREFKDGRYDLRATALDKAGNKQSSAPTQTLVDNTPPVIYLGSLPNPASKVITLSAKAVDEYGSGIELVVFELSSHEIDLGWGPWEEIGSVTSGWPFEVAFDTKTKPNGSYRLRAKAFDRAGHEGVSQPEDFTIKQPDPTGGVE